MRLHPASLTAALTFCALPALADPISGAAAGAMLYPLDQPEVIVHDVPGLNDQERAALDMVARTQRYYAAVAFAPDLGIMAEPTVMAANYHNPQAAADAALATCNARRTEGADCVLALEVRPMGFSQPALSLSADATEAFGSAYLTGSGPRALAISATSGQWGIGTGSTAAADAIETCRAGTEVSDCAVVIADR